MPKFIKSFKYALRGLAVLALAERNIKIEIFIASIVLILACVFQVSSTEFIFLLLAVALVFLSELANTAIEKTLDFVHPDYHESVRDIKDLSAGMVLVASLFAFFVGLIIFLPYFLDLFYRA